jgi:hypothetical protein
MQLPDSASHRCIHALALLHHPRIFERFEKVEEPEKKFRFAVTTSTMADLKAITDMGSRSDPAKLSEAVNTAFMAHQIQSFKDIAAEAAGSTDKQAAFKSLAENAKRILSCFFSHVPTTRYREVAAEFALAMHQALFQDVMDSSHPENPVQKWIKTISANLDRASRPDFEHQRALAPFLDAFDLAGRVGGLGDGEGHPHGAPDNLSAAVSTASTAAPAVPVVPSNSEIISDASEGDNDEYRQMMIDDSVYRLRQRMETIRYEPGDLEDAYHPLTTRASSSLEYLRLHLNGDWCRRAAAQFAAAVPAYVLARGLPDTDDPREAWAGEIMRLASCDSLSLQHDDGEADNGDDVAEEEVRGGSQWPWSYRGPEICLGLNDLQFPMHPHETGEIPSRCAVH